MYCIIHSILVLVTHVFTHSVQMYTKVEFSRRDGMYAFGLVMNLDDGVFYLV